MNSFDAFATDQVVIVNPDGSESPPLKCIFESKKVTIFSDSLDVEEGQKILRVLPTGRRDTYTVQEVSFSGRFHSIPASYELAIRKDSSLLSDATRPTTNISISNSHGFQVGDHNVQNIINAFTQILKSIDSADAAPSEKREAKERLLAFLSHPLVSTVLGAASGGLVEQILK
jgi:hypothetical protein